MAYFWQFDVEVDTLTVSSGFQLYLYMVFLLCHLLGHLHSKTSVLFVYEMTVGITGITVTNHKIQHEKILNDLWHYSRYFPHFMKITEFFAVWILIIVFPCSHLSPVLSVNYIQKLGCIQVQLLVRIFHRWYYSILLSGEA